MSTNYKTVMSAKSMGPIRDTYDIVVAGGGILGLCVAYEATRRGRSVLVLERDTICGAASGNTLRIVHGGFRYLQKLRVRRFRESLAEQEWFLSQFPECVEPLPCILPLDGCSLRRPLVANIASQIDSLLAGTARSSRLPRAGVLNRAEIAARFHCNIQTDSGLVWNDAFITEPDQIVRSLVSRVRSLGGEIIETATCERITNNNASSGVEIRHERSGHSQQVNCTHVVFCCGSENSHAAKQIGVKTTETPSVSAHNFVFDTPPQMRCGIAIPTKSQTYFAVPRGEQLVIGTSYTRKNAATSQDIAKFIYDLHDVPQLYQHNWRLTTDSLATIESGRIVAKQPGSLEPADRPHIHVASIGHGRGSVTFCTTAKYTTARSAAVKILRRIGCAETAPQVERSLA